MVIEHNLDVIKTADHIIDIGPEGGDRGGYVIAQGTPEEVAKVKETYTGIYINRMLEKDKVLSEAESKTVTEMVTETGNKKKKKSKTVIEK